MTRKSKRSKLLWEKSIILWEKVPPETFAFHTLVPYTTRPMRSTEVNGRDYFFTDEAGLSRLQEAGRVIELRSYQTVHGIWNYFTVDDGQVDLANDSYLLVGTLESYRKVQAYYGLEQVIPIYVEVEDGLRLSRAVERERAQREPKYAELCRRFLADEADFSEEKLSEAGIVKRFQNDDLERCLQEIFRKITKLEGDE